MNIISNGMTKTCLAVLFGVVLTASGLWASAGAEEEPAAAAEKEMVMDPSTGEMVTAPEYGGTLTFANKLATVYIDSFYGGFAGSTQSGFTEKLGIATWEIDRNVFNLQSGYVPLSVIRGSLLQNSGAQERSRRRQVRTNRLVAFRRRIRRQDICGGSNRPESRAEAASLAGRSVPCLPAGRAQIRR